jgi:hypothetical protein
VGGEKGRERVVSEEEEEEEEERKTKGKKKVDVCMYVSSQTGG